MKVLTPLRAFIPRTVFDFKLDTDDLAQLDTLTTVEALNNFEKLYAKCIVRDTPLAD